MQYSVSIALFMIMPMMTQGAPNATQCQ